MLLGQSVFQSVLDRVSTDAGEAEPAALPGFRIAGLPAGFVAEVAAAESRPADPAALFSAFDDDRPPPLPDWLDRLSEADVAAELAIAPEDTPASLSEKRRAFARLCHPDRVAEPHRAAALQRMTIANRLIDAAIAACARSA